MTQEYVFQFALFDSHVHLIMHELFCLTVQNIVGICNNAYARLVILLLMYVYVYINLC
jgi:hypothetical protein